MALLSFPPSPTPGELYPLAPLPGQVQYRWDSPNQTWVLEGVATGVAAGTYGDANNVGQFTVDTQGRITFAQNVPITGVVASAFAAKGDILVGTGPNAFAALPVGADGFSLTANSACAEGVEWVASSGAVPATPTTFGTVIGLTDASANAGLGSYALFSVTSGGGNVAIGESALSANTTGSYNTAVGNYAAYSNVSGSYNTAVGLNVFNSNVSGEFNNAYGVGALGANISGCYNNAYGWGALGVSVGDNNVAMGTKAMACNLAGSFNTGIGDCAICNVTSGCNNVGLGYQSGFNVTTGCNNVAIGPQTQVASPTGDCQLAIGFSSTDNWLTGDSTKAIQPGAGIKDCAGLTGSNGQVLMSTGANAVCWSGGVTGVYAFGAFTVTICNGIITSVV